MFILIFTRTKLNAAEMIPSAGTFDLEVIIIIDNNDELNNLDPDGNIRIAANLFIDLAAAFDSRVGYFIGSSNQSIYRSTTDLISFRRDIKDGISNAPAPSGQSLLIDDLYETLSLFTQSSTFNPRNRSIILVSPTLDENELHNFVQYAYDEGILVFTIFPPFFNIEDLFMEIFGVLVDSAKINLSFNDTRNIEIPIFNRSMYGAAVVITSSGKVADVELTNVSGEAVPHMLSSDWEENYAVIKLLSPTFDTIYLSFTEEAYASTIVSFFPIYDISLVLGLPVPDVGSVDISWTLENYSGTNIRDELLISAIAPTLIYKNTYTQNIYSFEFPTGHQTATLHLEPGGYEAHLIHNEFGFHRASNSWSFVVPESHPAPRIELVTGTNRAFLVTMFRRNINFSIKNAIQFEEENLPLRISVAAGVDDLIDWNFVQDINGGYLNISAINSGRESILFTATDVHGQTAVFQLDVIIVNGLIFVIVFAVVFVLIVVKVVLKMIASKPFLSAPMIAEMPVGSKNKDRNDENKRGLLALRVKLPEGHGAPPGAREFILPAESGKKTLEDIFNLNTSTSAPYKRAFAKIEWFTKGTVLEAKSYVLLEIKFPSSSGFTISVNGSKNKRKAVFNVNGGARVVIASLDGEYVIEFGNI